MTVAAVTPELVADSLLFGAQFIDAFAITITDPVVDAPMAAERILGRSPIWARALLKLRDLIVRPFGLKAAANSASPGRKRFGMFPVLSQTLDRVVVGLDDRHLDFRAVIDVTNLIDRRRVTMTTIVRTHNWLGRTYLSSILPFHRIIVRSMLEQASKP